MFLFLGATFIYILTSNLDYMDRYIIEKSNEHAHTICLTFYFFLEEIHNNLME